MVMSLRPRFLAHPVYTTVRALRLLDGRQEEHPVRKRSDDVLASLALWREMQIVCHYHCRPKPIISCLIKIQNLPFSYRLVQCPGKAAVNRTDFLFCIEQHYAALMIRPSVRNN